MAVFGGPDSKPNLDVAVSMDTWTGKITHFWNRLMQSRDVERTRQTLPQAFTKMDARDSTKG